jgi:phage terminase large subunit-like protein
MTPPPTVRNPLRVIVTYAGFEGESELLWQIYEDNFLHGEDVPELVDIVDDNGETVCRRKGRVFVYWDTVPRMPWQTIQYYEEQMATLRPTDFLRLHRNQWVTTKEEFIPVKFWDEAAKKLEAPLVYMREHPAFGLPISVGVDAGIKNDCTAVVGTYFDYKKGEVGIAFHRIWTPPPDEAFDLTVIEDYIWDMSKYLPIAAVVYDPTQLHQAMTNLQKKGFTTIPFQQTVENMTKATHNLYDLLKNGNLSAYEADDMREHIRFAAAEVKGRGYRLVKPLKSGRKKIDGAIALAMAAYDSVMRGGVDTTEVITVESPFGDVSEYTYIDPIKEQMEALLPEELRS